LIFTTKHYTTEANQSREEALLMSAARDESMLSVEAYFALEAAHPDIRYEYLDGDVLMMSGGSRRHAILSQSGRTD
jgi:Uma2 family endonuclease